MTLKVRTATFFSMVSAAILIIQSSILVTALVSQRKRDFYDLLKGKASSIAELYCDDKTPDSAMISDIINSYPDLSDANINIYDNTGKLVFMNGDGKDLSFGKVQEYRKKPGYYHKNTQNDREQILYYYKGHVRSALVVVDAFDAEGITRLNKTLRYVLISSFLGILLAGLSGFLFARKILEPLTKFSRSIENIDVNKKFIRLPEGNNNDEIDILSRSFNRLFNRIEEMIELERSFIHHASHEIKTPVTILLGETELMMMRQEKDPEAIREYLKKIRKEIKDLASLVEGLLTLADRADKPSTENMRPIRLDEVLFKVCSKIVTENPSYKVVIDETSFPPESEIFDIKGNAILLDVLFRNVIVNACKYSEDHSAFISFHFDDLTLKVKIADKGIGIPDDEKERVFHPFYRGKNAGSIKGYGLGLAISHQIVQYHNASISIEDNDRKGTIITLIFNR